MLEKLYIGIFIEFVIVCCLLTIGIEAGHRVRSSSNNELRYFAFTIESEQETKDFKKLLQPLLIPRVSGSEGSRIVQRYIKDHFHNLKWQVEEDTFDSDTPLGKKPFNNIMVTHDPTKKEKLTLACHFDSKYITGKGGVEFIGASDSAVPCAILMDLAAKLNYHLNGKRASTIYNEYTVQMLFLDGEEAFEEWTYTDSLYGSRHLAELWAGTLDPADMSQTRLETMSLFILLDLIGPTDVSFRNVFDSSSKYFQNFMKKEEQLMALQPAQTGGGNILFSKESYRGFIDDDHRPFMRLREDLKILHLISIPFPKVWHTMEDNEKAINYDVTRKFNQVFRMFVVDYLGLKPSSVGRQ